MSPSKTAAPRVVEKAIKNLRARQEELDNPRLVEKDLVKSMEEAANELLVREEISSYKTGFRAPIPGWWPAPGDVDFVVEYQQALGKNWDLFELKWCNSAKLEEALWDVVKLLSAHGNEQVRDTHLIYGAPKTMWDASAAARDCFSGGSKSLDQLLGSHASSWQWNLSGAVGRPQVVPLEFEVKRTGEHELSAGGSQFQIRTIKIKPVGVRKLRLGEKPFKPGKKKWGPRIIEDLTAKASVKVRNAQECPVCKSPVGKPCRSTDDGRTLGNKVHRGRLVRTKNASEPMTTTAGSGKRGRANHRTGKER